MPPTSKPPRWTEVTTPDLSTKKQAAAADARGFEVVEARCARYRIPLEQPVLGASARTGVTPTPLSAWELVVVEVRTAAGHVGTGFAYELRAGGRAVEAALRDDLLPLLTGADCRKT
jgi:hypothetical protein